MSEPSMEFRAVGYWRQIRHPDWPAAGDQPSASDSYPDPTDLVDPGWLTADRNALLGYLGAGQVLAQWRGHSYCRFHCGAEFSEMGSRCLSDGIWCWPEGLGHYVAVHGVRLPDDFVDHMRAAGWTVPSNLSFGRQAHRSRRFDWWINWAEDQLT